MRTKLPELREEVIATEVRDRESGMKAKAKVYADNKRNAKHSDLSPGDKVLVKQDRQNKLSTPFSPEPHEVVTKTGNSVVIESPEGVQLKRDTTHVEKYEGLPLEQEKTPLPVDNAPTEPEAQQGATESPVLLRQTRVRKLPEKFKDFVMT